MINYTKRGSRKYHIAGIYGIISPSGRTYIGQSWNIKGRWHHHKNMDKRGCAFVNASFAKYGVAAHRFIIFHQFPLDVPQKTMNDYEMFFISQYKEAGEKIMNLNEGGSNARASDETKEKLRARMMGKKYGLGTVRPLSAILATSDKNRGRKHTEEAKRKISERRGTPANVGLWNIGKVRTVENREKIRASLKARSDNKGSFHKMAKLSELQVKEIREKYIPREYSLSRLAAEYNISKRVILDIIHRKIWRHI